MLTYAKPDYTNTCAQLDRAIQELRTRIRVNEQNTKLKATYEEKIETYTRSSKILNTILDLIKPMREDVQTYINNRRKESMNNINNALRLAGEIIPDAGDGVYFNLDNDEAWLSTRDGLEVDTVEGGGFRQISSAFIRATIVKSNPAILDTMLFDEVFSLVSVENSATLSLYLNWLGQDMQIISIEQKPQVYSNVSGMMYHFDKVGELAQVTAEKLENASLIPITVVNEDGAET